MTETKIVTITNSADWREGDMAERVWPDGTTLRGVLRQSGSVLFIGSAMFVSAVYADGTLPDDGSTVTVTREVPDRVLPTTLGAVILATKVRGVTLDPPVVAALYDGGGWFTAAMVGGTHYHLHEHIEEWVPATVLPTEAVGCSREIVTAALRKVSINDDWSTISGDDLRTIRDALTEVQA